MSVDLLQDISLEPPANLDPETRLEWDKWMGREVWARTNVIGVVALVRRRNFRRWNLLPEQVAEAERAAREAGSLWEAVVRFVDKGGRLCSDVRELSFLRSVHADLDTRVVVTR